jgi:hypothetical protein
MKRLLEVKKQIGTLSKQSKNPFFKSSYLDLNGLLDAVEPLLWEQGLLLLQPIQDNKVYSVIIDSESGETLFLSEIQLPPITDPQKLGSCITYFRRYTLKSLLAISEEDDDGNKASKPTPKKKPTLSDKGYEYLITSGTYNDIRSALEDREMTLSQKNHLTAELLAMDIERGTDGNN